MADLHFAGTEEENAELKKLNAEVVSQLKTLILLIMMDADSLLSLRIVGGYR